MRTSWVESGTGTGTGTGQDLHLVEFMNGGAEFLLDVADAGLDIGVREFNRDPGVVYGGCTILLGSLRYTCLC